MHNSLKTWYNIANMTAKEPMKINNIPTDEALRSLLTHGCAEFPFEYYLDEIDRFRSKSIEWHWHREVEFSLILRGTVRCCDGRNAYHLTAGDGLFVNAETLHRFESDDGGIMVNMVFAPELIAPQRSLLFTEYVESVLTSECSLVPFRKDNAREQPVLHRIACLYKATGKNLFAVRNAASLLWESLLDFAGGELAQAQNKVDKLLRARMQKMVQHIHGNYQKRITLCELAAAANISVSESLRCFHAAVQTTPIQYLNDYRLGRAKELLFSTLDSVTNIAAATGFESPSYFCRVFKKRYGVSPNTFRNSYT